MGMGKGLGSIMGDRIESSTNADLSLASGDGGSPGISLEATISA